MCVVRIYINVEVPTKICIDALIYVYVNFDMVYKGNTLAKYSGPALGHWRSSKEQITGPICTAVYFNLGPYYP